MATSSTITRASRAWARMGRRICDNIITCGRSSMVEHLVPPEDTGSIPSRPLQFSVGEWIPVAEVADTLRDHHYLGPSKRGVAYRDDWGVMVFAKPTARNVPWQWLELVRWCILKKEPNTGSRQWASCVRSIRKLKPDVTTIISYSDPSVGHTGALYRACNWWWAPTWHRLRPPPTGNGSWKSGVQQSVKDRWVFALKPDVDRARLLVASDESILRRHPRFRYKEPGGVPYVKL